MRKATDKSTEPLQTITDRRACCHNSNLEVPQREQVVDALQHLHSPGVDSQVNCVRGDRDAHTRSRGVTYSDGDSDSDKRQRANIDKGGCSQTCSKSFGSCRKRCLAGRSIADSDCVVSSAKMGQK